jgi:hypothetical protein
MRRGMWSLMLFAASSLAPGQAMPLHSPAAPVATVAQSPRLPPRAMAADSWWAWARYCVARSRRRRKR